MDIRRPRIYQKGKSVMTPSLMYWEGVLMERLSEAIDHACPDWKAEEEAHFLRSLQSSQTRLAPMPLTERGAEILADMKAEF